MFVEGKRPFWYCSVVVNIFVSWADFNMGEAGRSVSVYVRNYCHFFVWGAVSASGLESIVNPRVKVFSAWLGV